MIKTEIPILLAGMLLLALPARALPAGDAPQDILVTDPALLENLGFDADATNVYATERALRHIAMSPAERAADDAALLATAEVDPAGGPYGLGDGFTTISQRSLRPRFASASAPAFCNSDLLDGLYCIDGTHTYEAPIESVPHGARLISAQVYVYDDSPEDINARLLRTCQSSPNAAPVFTLLDQLETVGSPTYHGLLLVAGNDTIDHRTCEYSLQVRLDDDDEGTCSELNDLRLYKARAAWRRQISPPPVTATFDDVPTGHLFFRHVEALVASGITSGCNAENYCPDAPLTRGQMAAFLATALGLHWGVF